ncbi:MAG: outer membrane lipid asymmetry maintenance protein MlaD [Gammaproteobacteria bacterium]|nr:outer membrane lipid asymmetry maintenance protein MlaD [Gammaproteobacteria bacterium]MDH5653634.1 outer membrane lipid asymmetry maintenance protein MlaD [Gammaproteobacteria bacterium]
MNSRMVEIWVGIFVAAGAAALFMLAMKVSNLSSYSNDEGYTVTARFEDASGLKVRSPVSMAGVRIGRVTGISFDKHSLEAVVTMRIEKNYDTLPSGTSASIYTAGLLGEKYIGLEPGSGASDCDDALLAELEGKKSAGNENKECKEEVLKDGTELKLTQGSMVLEKLIGQFVSRFLSEGDADKEKKK